MTWNDEICERESETRRLAGTSAGDAALQEHAASCPACLETLTVASLMRDLAAIPANRPLPDPAYLWWKGELLRRWDAERRAAAPIEHGEPVQAGIGLLGTLALLLWLWRQGPALAPVAREAWVWNGTLLLIAIVSLGVLVAITIASLRDVFETERKERT
jgi:hypothetical protein